MAAATNNIYNNGDDSASENNSIIFINDSEIRLKWLQLYWLWVLPIVNIHYCYYYCYYYYYYYYYYSNGKCLMSCMVFNFQIVMIILTIAAIVRIIINNDNSNVSCSRCFALLFDSYCFRRFTVVVYNSCNNSNIICSN